ncbi:hypothetical protein LOTGIDRAFT_155286 [Lottia gigantea]|uniref:Uncharacterized protein n=1 Tax=Lottia gigantea TaxID=225164 RepID=V3ZND9_LOTGI|nr:hypothetical protein LOTGIDRAFT_155286 [Lottia gigantea]ESO83975.1 hypothetical protein LOTGIDRAFT_155286 [Lottia gigantea]
MDFLSPKDHGGQFSSRSGSISGLGTARSGSISQIPAGLDGLNTKHRGSLFPSSVTARSPTPETKVEDAIAMLEVGQMPRYSVDRSGSISIMTGRKSSARPSIVPPAWKTLMKAMFPIVSGKKMSINEEMNTIRQKVLEEKRYIKLSLNTFVEKDIRERNIKSAPARRWADVAEITGKRRKSFSNPEIVEK